MNVLIKGIKVGRVIAARKAGKPTTPIFEDPLSNALAHINGHGGIQESVDAIFSNIAVESTENIQRAQQIQATVRKVRLQLKLLTRPFLRFAVSCWPMILVLLLAIGLMAWKFIDRSDSPEPGGALTPSSTQTVGEKAEKVGEQVQQDVKAVIAKAQEGTALDRFRGVIGEINKIGQSFNTLLGTVGAILAALASLKVKQKAGE